MDFEFDDKKDKQNREYHGVSLQEACTLWEKTHLIIPAKNVSGESRFMILGLLKGKIYAAIFTRRDESIRIISCHRADKRWERIYYEYTKQEKEDY